MNSPKRILATLACAAVLTLTSAACGGGGSKASYCDTLKSWNAKAASFDKGAAPGSKGFEDNMKKTKEALSDMVSSAPSEIKGDMQTLADQVDVLADVDYSDPKSLAEASKNLDQAKLQKATDNIQKYTKDKCGTDFSSVGG